MLQERRVPLSMDIPIDVDVEDAVVTVAAASPAAVVDVVILNWIHDVMDEADTEILEVKWRLRSR